MAQRLSATFQNSYRDDGKQCKWKGASRRTSEELKAYHLSALARTPVGRHRQWKTQAWHLRDWFQSPPSPIYSSTPSAAPRPTPGRSRHHMCRASPHWQWSLGHTSTDQLLRSRLLNWFSTREHLYVFHKPLPKRDNWVSWIRFSIYKETYL